MNYITTPIYYASGEPHLGHAYTTLLADARRRYLQLRHGNCRLLTGTDEHGQKISRTAERQGITVEEFVAEKSAVFKNLWQNLEIDCDFVRTTDASHVEFVRSCWNKLLANDDLYVGDYTGSYCVECEQFLRGVEECPVHKIPLEIISESGYFFRLSKYQNQLIAHLENHEQFITPRSRYEEALSFLTNQPLQDLSVSRRSTSWGIPVPGDADQVIYVWLDALLSYLSALGLSGSSLTELESEEQSLVVVFQQAEHFIGKDILIFHAVYWPAILLALNLPLPKALRVNGWLTVEGQKIAKSNPATIKNPAKLAEQYSLDGLRTYLLSCTVSGQDVDFSEDKLRDSVNHTLANTIGNLVGRCAALFAKNYPEGISKPESQPEFAAELWLLREKVIADYEESFEQGDPARACRVCFDFASRLNGYFQNSAPWHQTESEQSVSLWWFHGFLQDLTLLLAPFTPELSGKARQVLRLGLLESCEQCFQPKIDQLRSAARSSPLVVKIG